MRFKLLAARHHIMGDTALCQWPNREVVARAVVIASFDLANNELRPKYSILAMNKHDIVVFFLFVKKSSFV